MNAKTSKKAPVLSAASEGVGDPAPSPRRKGYNRRADVPPAILKRLNSGLEDPLTLSEWLVIDARKLLPVALKDSGLDKQAKQVMKLAEPSMDEGPVARNAAIGRALHQSMDAAKPWRAAFDALSSHRSGVVREWAAMMLCADAALPLDKRLEMTHRFADDPMANVREIAWMSLRPHLEKQLKFAIESLAPWVRADSPNIRRCAIEATRPRGVWCAHLQPLKADPSPGLPLLEPVRSDASRYVKLSVGNWLNDAGKQTPAWVKKVCARWLRESRTPDTKWIVKHALRTITKAEQEQ